MNIIEMRATENLNRIKRNLNEEGAIETIKKIFIHLLHRKISPIFAEEVQKKTCLREELNNICSNNNYFFNIYDGERSYKLESPIALNQEREQKKQYVEETQTEPPLVCEINNVTVLSTYAVPISPFGYLPEKGLSSKNIFIGLLSALLHGTTPAGRSFLKSKQNIDTAIFLVGPHDKNYYHWFNNYLPRLEGLHHYPKAEETTIVIPANASQWQLDSLRLLGFSNFKIVEWPGRPVDVGTYVLSQYRIESQTEATNRSRIKSKENFRWMADQFYKNIILDDYSKKHRIYISREDATTRRTVNENEVMSTLSKYGFKKYTLSNLSLEEQTKLFHQADMIVGAHGAGLVNMMFSDNASVIELLGPKTSINSPGVFYNMSQVLDHTYACIDTNVIHRNIHVDTDELEQIVNKLLDSKDLR